MDGGASPLWNNFFILDAAGVKRCMFHLGYLKAPPRVVVGGPSLKISPDIALTLITCGAFILFFCNVDKKNQALNVLIQVLSVKLDCNK